MFTFTKSSTNHLIAKGLNYLYFLSSVPHSLRAMIPYSFRISVSKCLHVLFPFFPRALVPWCLCPLFPLLLLSSCSPQLTPQEYISYFEHNRSKFTKAIQRNDIKATVAYVPPEYYAALAMENDTTLIADSVLKRYENSLFFVFSIKSSKENTSLSPLLSRQGINGFKENVEHNQFEREQDIFLLHGKDTVKTVSIRYERNWGIGNDDSFLLGFAKKSLKEKVDNYNLIIRNMTPELGTVDIAVKSLKKSTKRLKGYQL